MCIEEGRKEYPTYTNRQLLWKQMQYLLIEVNTLGMPRKRGRQEKGVADPSGPPTTPPHARIRATSPPATLAPKRVK